MLSTPPAIVDFPKRNEANSPGKLSITPEYHSMDLLDRPRCVVCKQPVATHHIGKIYTLERPAQAGRCSWGETIKKPAVRDSQAESRSEIHATLANRTSPLMSPVDAGT